MKSTWRIRGLIPVFLAALSLGCMDCSNAPKQTGPATVAEEQTLASGLVQLPNVAHQAVCPVMVVKLPQARLAT